MRLPSRAVAVEFRLHEGVDRIVERERGPARARDPSRDVEIQASRALDEEVDLRAAELAALQGSAGHRTPILWYAPGRGYDEPAGRQDGCPGGDDPMKIAAAVLSFFLLPAGPGERAGPARARLRRRAAPAGGRPLERDDHALCATMARSRRSRPGPGASTGSCPDRVLSGRAVIPDWSQSAGMLFYLNERMFTLEMAQVGADGQLVVMSGPAGTESARRRRRSRCRTAGAWCSGTRAMASARTASKPRSRRATTAARAGSSVITSSSCARPSKQPESGARMQHRTRPQPYVPLT